MFFFEKNQKTFVCSVAGRGGGALDTLNDCIKFIETETGGC
jgi:hypothetical protein